MLAVVVQLIACLVTVVESAVVPVAVHKSVPVALLSLIFARGNTVPVLAVFLINRLKVSVEPEGITPVVFGSPVCVSNSLIKYSPTALLVSVVVMARLVASGPAVSSLSSAAVIAEASLCRWYVAVWATPAWEKTHESINSNAK